MGECERRGRQHDLVPAIALLITFGSPAAAGLPLLIAILGVGTSMASIRALDATFGLAETTGTLATMTQPYA